MDHLLLLLQSVLSVFGIRGAYEQPKYDVLARLKDGTEVRQYAARVAAETTVDSADESDGRNQAFNRLAKYIFGANHRRAGGAGKAAATAEKIAMTAPVQTAGKVEKVAMTTHVQTTTKTTSAAVDKDKSVDTKKPTGVTMRFFLPSKWTPDTAPTPTDARVRIVKVPAETIAVLRFSGSWDARRIQQKKEALLKSLEATPLRITGEPFTLFYDPPFTIPLLRRNEVAVAVERREK